jgi:hypothetical protein
MCPRLDRPGFLSAGALPCGPLAAASCLFVLVVFGRAQTPSERLPDFHGCTVHGGALWTQPQGADGHDVRAGWNGFEAGGGFGWRPNPRSRNGWSIFLTGDFLFQNLHVNDTSIASAQILNPTNIALLQAASARAKYYSATFGPTFRLPPVRFLGVYVFGGFGWFRRKIEFSGISGAGSLLQPSSPAVLGSGGDSGAIDAGGGLNIRPKHARGAMFYVEARVLHGLAINHKTTLVPVSAGFRW